MASGKSETSEVVELEHAIGYTCTDRPSLFYHPKFPELIYTIGASLGECISLSVLLEPNRTDGTEFTVVVRHVNDPHQQSFLRGHSAKLRSVALSPGGTFLASGDEGKESDIVVWDYVEKALIWRFSQHDGGVGCLAFSHDERQVMKEGQSDVEAL